MKNFSIGTKLFLSVITMFILFALAFIFYQQYRERIYKVEMLNMKLQDYNARMEESVKYIGDFNEQTLSGYVKSHYLPNVRVTLIDIDGRVFFDNMKKNYQDFPNHKGRKEIDDAFATGKGYDINRLSKVMNRDYFYSATYFPEDSFIIRSALPYDHELSASLKGDRHYLLFAALIMIVLILILRRFTNRLGDNIKKLRTFASRAGHNESLETEELIEFPDDELGEIAEKIIKLYKRLQTTKEEQNVLKRQLTQNIAHELKTPVASIQGYLETILENPNTDEKTQKQFLERSYAQTQRLTSLLQDISTLNRMDDAPSEKHFETVDISAMVKNIARETSLQVEEKNMAFSNNLPDGIVVNGNTSLLYSVFRNLTDNAIAYAGTGTTITLSAEDDGDYWNFIFSDNGVGVGTEHLPRIFERFYRVDKGRSRKMGGTGLGLAIVKNAVLLHGGKIVAKNNDGGGLRFEFSLKK